MADHDCTTSIYPPVYTKATLQAAFLHTCPVCGDRFSVEGRRGPKGSATYCSRTCWSIGNAKDDGNLLRVDEGTPVYRCLHCETEFTGRKRKYCGDECANKARGERRSAKRERTRPFKSIRRPNPIIDGMRVCIDCSHNLPLSEYTVLKYLSEGYANRVNVQMERAGQRNARRSRGGKQGRERPRGKDAHTHQMGLVVSELPQMFCSPASQKRMRCRRGTTGCGSWHLMIGCSPITMRLASPGTTQGYQTQNTTESGIGSTQNLICASE